MYSVDRREILKVAGAALIPQPLVADQTAASTTTIIDSFERSNPLEPYTILEEYRGTPEVDSSTHRHGDQSLHLKATIDKPNNPELYSTPTDGLNDYPHPGSTFEVWFKTDDAKEGGAPFYFGGYDLEKGYSAYCDFSNDRFVLRVDNGGPRNPSNKYDKASFTYSSNTWYRIVIDWRQSGKMIAELQNEDENVLAKNTVRDEKYSQGMIGFKRWSGTRELNHWFDHVAFIESERDSETSTRESGQETDTTTASNSGSKAIEDGTSSKNGDSRGADRKRRRGFFSNSGDGPDFLQNVFNLTVVGFVLSIAGIAHQMIRGN